MAIIRISNIYEISNSILQVTKRAKLNLFSDLGVEFNYLKLLFDFFLPIIKSEVLHKKKQISNVKRLRIAF